MIFLKLKRDELHSISKFLLTTKVLIAEEGVEETKKGIKESGKPSRDMQKCCSLVLAAFNT